MSKWKTAECRSCGAEIIWAVTERGKKMPVDAEPVSRGKFTLEKEAGNETPTASYLGPVTEYIGDRYNSHFSTCAHAGEHRRPREGAPESGCRPDGHGYCAIHPTCDLVRDLLDALRAEIARR